MQLPLKALILAAGLGTRLKSSKPKVLHKAGGRTLIEQVVESCSAVVEEENIFVVVGHGAGEVERALEGRRVGFVMQPAQRGTADAVRVARQQVGEQDCLLLVLYGDCPLIEPSTLASLVERHRHSSAALTMLTTRLEDPTGYGRVLRDAGGAVVAIIEQKAAGPDQLSIREINGGVYCFNSRPLWEHIDRIRPDNPAGEYYLTDIVALFRSAGLKVEGLLHPEPRELLGINNRIELAEADRMLRERINRRLMLDGVTIEKPETVTIDPQVRIGRDTVVGPFAQILGDTTIGEECSIGACSIIQDSRLGNRVTVGPFTIVGSSILEDDVQAGPYARLRMENHLEAGARVGNFVEMKKARLGAGSKALHLAYLGDAVIGSKANIGAGTITCNYDGIRKHQTTIGDGAFVGSNSTLVAPVTIGPGSYVAAGSVITKPVPEDALGIGRSRQENKPGWAKRRRQRSGQEPGSE